MDEKWKKRRKNTETNKTQMENKDTLYIIQICMYIEPQEFLAGFHLLNALHRHDVIIN